MHEHFSWPALLDSLEEQLRRQEAALRGEAEVPGELALSLLGPPLPPDLVPRALSLLDWCRSLERDAAEQVNRRRPPARAYGDPGRRDLGAL
jgi:hypothetical protein